MQTTKHAQIIALNSGDITALVLAANPGPAADRLTLEAGRGLFRFRSAPDHDYDIDGDDTYNQAANPDIEPAVMKAQRAKELRRVNEWGVWGVITEVRPDLNHAWQNPDPKEPGSLWGNVGADFIGSGYDSEQIASAAAYFEALRLDKAPATPAPAVDAPQAAIARELLTLRQLADSVGDIDHDSYLLTLGRLESLLTAPAPTPAPVLGFDGFGLNNIADEYRSRVFTLSGEYRPGNAKAEEGAAFLAALEATGVVTRNY